MCSFAQNGANYVHQHWYICYTCGLVDQHGCCGACVQACHAGHDTVYSSCSNFFCDCGSGSVRWVLLLWCLWHFVLLQFALEFRASHAHNSHDDCAVLRL